MSEGQVGDRFKYGLLQKARLIRFVDNKTTMHNLRFPFFLSEFLSWLNFHTYPIKEKNSPRGSVAESMGKRDFFLMNAKNNSSHDIVYIYLMILS
jgi:hypothetical protein